MTAASTNGGVDTTTLSVVSTVTVVAVNDPPVITNLDGDSVSVAAGDGSVFVDAGGDANVISVDSPDFDGGILRIINVSGGGLRNGNFSVDGVNVTSGDDAIVTMAKQFTSTA